jgi:peptidyl-prolyl isomerase D
MPDNSPPELKDSFDALLAPLLLNSALAAIRSEPPSNVNANVAVKNATRALDTLELNTSDKGMISILSILNIISDLLSVAKALYRRALASAVLKEEVNAEKDLVEASSLVPDDKAIAGELAKLRQRRKEKREKERKAFKKMFA